MRTWTVQDVMTEAVVSVPPYASYRELVDKLIGHRVSAMPVVDDFHRVVGVVSEADLLRKIEYAGDEEGWRHRADRAKAKGRTARDLMTAPAVTVTGDASIAAAARLLDAKRVKRLPVVDAEGRLVGLVTRGDLLKVHLRPDDELLADVRDALAGGLLPEDGPAVDVLVAGGVVTLTGKVGRWSATDLAGRLVRRTPGVVGVIDRLTFDFDDQAYTGPGLTYI